MQTKKQRERLVELINKSGVSFCNFSVGNYDEEAKSELADYLIKNGVTLSVMCCECKYCETVLNIIGDPKLFCTRLVGSIPVDFTDYCSYGKVRENVK